MEGKKYSAFSKFLQTHAIIHQLSCPYTHERNGYAKRKHSNIIEMGLSLLAKGSMPLKFWGEAFQIAFYLINNKNQLLLALYFTSHQAIMNSKSLVVPITHIYGLTTNIKFNIGLYNVYFLDIVVNTEYLCLASTRKTYIARHVQFDEKLFPFQVNPSFLIRHAPTSSILVYASIKDSNVLVDAQTEPKTIKIKTWSLVPLPLGHKAVGCK
ncbi:hypothetical protein CR513_31374, partial [Mucuna pruriens]